MGKTLTAGKPQEKEKTITEQLNEVIEKFCSDYCKYPDICLAEEKDPDVAEDMLYRKYCDDCPFQLI